MGEVRESRADRTKRKLSMLAGFTAFRSQAMSPDTSGRPLRPPDVAHAMTFIRQRRRDPETGELAPRDLFWCRLSELLLTFLYVEVGRPGPTMEELRRLLTARAEGITRLSRADADFPVVGRMADLAICELSQPSMCRECGGAATVPEWRWQQLMQLVVDWTRVRPVDCPKCGGTGLKPLSGWKRYRHLRVGHETYHKRWRTAYEALLDDCHRAMGEGLAAISAALS